MHFCKDFDCDMENKGDSIVITIKGEKEKLEKLERKLKAMRELCGCGETDDGEGCCKRF